MPELNVYFWGLICHANITGQQNVSDVAALVLAPSHVPMILFSKEAGDHYDLDSGMDIRFDHGTESAEIDRTSFDAYVPSLGSILGGQLRLLPSVAIYFRYPRAENGNPELSVLDTYGYKANHISKFSRQNKRSNKPVARIIRLKVSLDRNTVTVRFKSGGEAQAKTIDSDSCILLTNVESYYAFLAARDLKRAGNELAKEGAGNILAAGKEIFSAGTNLERYAEQISLMGPNHFEYFSNLLGAADTAVAEEADWVDPVTFSENDCDWVVEYVDAHSRFARSGVRPECGNTNYP